MDIEKLFNTFHEEAFRLECLPEYSIDSEISAITEFSKTGVIQTGFNSGWLEIIRASSDRQASVKCLRLLSREPTPYESFELAAYKQNVNASEDIRVVYRDDFAPQQDFWIFDMHWIALMKYGKLGDFKGVSIRKATKQDLENVKYWKTVFEDAKPV